MCVRKISGFVLLWGLTCSSLLRSQIFYVYRPRPPAFRYVPALQTHCAARLKSLPQVQRVQQMHPSGDAISEVATDVVIPSARAARARSRAAGPHAGGAGASGG